MRLRCLKLLLAIGLVASVGAPACSSAPSTPGDGQRIAVIQQVSAAMEALVNARPDATPADLQALLAARPEIVETGVEAEGAWGRFADGRLFYLLDDRDGAGTASTQSATTPDTPPYELPTSDRVLLINTLGTYFVPVWNDLKPWFDHKAYLTTFRDGTVQELKDVSGQGVLYMNSHGGRAKSRSGEMLTVVATATPVAPVFDVLYLDDLKDDSLAYVSAKRDLLPNGKVSVLPVYGFTQKFVTKYMNLHPGSLVVMDACKSSSPELTAAFTSKGASLYAGRSDRVADVQAEKTVKYLFDRLLAANEFLPEAPPQRPFNYVEVYENMNQRGLVTWPTRRGGTTTFGIMPGSAQTLGLLVPSIKHMVLNAVGDTSVLLLSGSFGTLEGKVLVNGNALACTDWYSDILICPVAASGAAGVGKVVVDTNATQSNVRTLTEWKGAFTYTGKIGCGPGSARGITATIRANVRFRADVGAFREHAGQPPVTEAIQFNVERDKTVFASASGECSYTWPGPDPETTRWSGTADVPWEDDHSLGVVDVAHKRIRLHLELYSGSAFQEATTCSGTLCSQGPVSMSYRTGDDGFQDGVDPFAEAIIDIPLDGALNGIAGSRQGPEPADYWVPRGQLSWTTLTASSPPDPNAQQ